ncbi:MAG: phage tail tube protein [Candidatus Paceibacterota bacterium]|jgi:hypothetical protein
MNYVGRQKLVGLALEATRGVAESVAAKWLKHVDNDIYPRVTKVVDDSHFGVLEDSQGSRVVQKWLEGTINGIVHADSIGYLLANIYGSVATEALGDGVYEHTFDLLQNIEHPTLSIFVHDSDVDKSVINCGVISSLELSASVDDYLRFTAGIVAKEKAANSDTPSFDAENDFIGRDVSIQLADTLEGLDAAPVIKAKNFTISKDPGVVRDHVLGSQVADGIYNSKMAIEGNFVINHNGTTYEALLTGDTAKFMKVTIESAAVIGSDDHPSLTYVFHKIQVQDRSRIGGNDELVTEEVGFKAFYNQTTGKASTAILVNKTASYATGS